jgi:hypothetical protein
MTRITKLTELAPAVAVAKARHLDELGWRVCITDRVGRQFKPGDFDMLLDCSASLSLSLHQAGRISRRRCTTPAAITRGDADRKQCGKFISTDRALATQRSFR